MESWGFKTSRKRSSYDSKELSDFVNKESGGSHLAVQPWLKENCFQMYPCKTANSRIGKIYCQTSLQNLKIPQKVPFR